MDQLIQMIRFVKDGGRLTAASTVASLRSENDPRAAFREEVSAKRAALPRSRSRRGDMHRWCGRRKRVRLGDTYVTIYEEA